MEDRSADDRGTVISSVLVANRGEIAVRLIRTYRELGVRTIAVYSDADAAALPVRLADEARRLGPAPVTASYLNQGAVIDAARAAGAAAVDPGYGLLSENAEFAAAVADAGLVFIGPPAAVIAAMGDKLAARATAERAGVPVVPGSSEIITPGQGLAEAARLGYPVLVKASAGGGGRGMRIARDAAGLPGALAAAAAEAQAAFGQPGVYLERHLADARHVEVQVLADEHGTVLCLGDRDCSVQRRHQKLIEEAPAPFLPDGVRAAMHAAAARLAAEAGYRSTGTAEFLYSPARGQFWFLEMNTRLQVEHGVTELVTGLDLVERRLAVAAGEPVGLTQEGVRIRGHAIEVRLAAEDPGRHFLPVPGTVTGLHVPAGPWLRADLGVAAGDQVPAEYDSLFGKLMAWGPDRETARRRLAAALGELRVDGLPSTAPYLRDVLLRPEFADGAYSTATLEESWPAVDHEVPAHEPGTARTVEVRTNMGPFVVKIYGRPGPDVASVRTGRGAGPRPGPQYGPRAPAAAGQPAAPMDGVVVKVEVARGDEVARHAVLVVLEAMKMQVPVTAPWAGRVTALLVAEGDSVTAGQPLAAVSADAGGE